MKSFHRKIILQTHNIPHKVCTQLSFLSCYCCCCGLFRLAVVISSDPKRLHYSDVIMGAMASKNTILTIVYSTAYSGADQRKHVRHWSFVSGIHLPPVRPVMQSLSIFVVSPKKLLNKQLKPWRSCVTPLYPFGIIHMRISITMRVNHHVTQDIFKNQSRW